MKNVFLVSLVFFFATFSDLHGQSQVIIDENFQEWEGTDDTNPEDCEEGLVHDSLLTRTMSLITSSGETDITVTLIKCGIAPECDTKRFERSGTASTEGVTVGYVSMAKMVEETDTIGEFIFGPIPQIDSIRFGFSATGSSRGIRIYKSLDGDTWDRATEDEFNDSDDSQAGDVKTVVIDETDVYIKFTSGVGSDDSTSQMSRLHNLEVFGVPGELSSVDNKHNNPVITIENLGNNLLKINGLINNVQVYNVIGKTVEAIYSNKMLDISNLPNGMYIIMVKGIDGTFVSEKILKY